MRDALEDAVKRRPNWAEGYLRLGLVHLGLYRRRAREWLEDSQVDPREIARMAEPLWLLGAFHDHRAMTTGPAGETDVLSLEPIRDHLVPALTCFLEARRCSPFLALSHAELASLNELLENGDTASTYVARALRLSGNDSQLIEFLAQVAVQTGDRGLAAQCWRKQLRVNPSSWSDVADEAAAVLSTDELLSDVVTDGHGAVRFAERLVRRRRSARGARSVLTGRDHTTAVRPGTQRGGAAVLRSSCTGGPQSARPGLRANDRGSGTRA